MKLMKLMKLKIKLYNKMNTIIFIFLIILFILLFYFHQQIKISIDIFRYNYIHPLKKRSMGFIMLRHVNNELSNKYWIHSYNCIRKYYKENMIVIIDDNSNYDYITNIDLYKTIIIQSQYHKRGEILPYYYYLQNNFFDIAVILHDSVFINNYINFYDILHYEVIWDFEHHWDQIEDETKMIELFNDQELLKFYENKNLWKGCFGSMSIITFDFLNSVNNKYNISKLLNVIKTRYNRCSFERVIGCLLQKVYNDKVYNRKTIPLLGNIHKYMRWETTFDEIDNYKDLPIIKVWTGR